MSEMDDIFGEVGAAPVAKFPTMAQIGSDGPKLKLVYGKGTDQEQIKDWSGRLVIVTPVKLEHNIKSQFAGNPPGDRMSVDVVILDGPPITVVVDKDGEEVYTFPEPLVPGTNAELKAMYTSHTVLIGQLNKLMVNGESARGRMTFGRVMKLNPKPGSTNKPWALGRAVDEKQAAKDSAVARAWVAAHPAPDPFA
jgi:hypothetical protein